MSNQKRLLAFALSEEDDQLFLHTDIAGIDILLSELERIRKSLERDEVAHAHLFTNEWGDGDLSISNRVDTGKGKPIHHVKMYGWTEEWAEKHKFDRS